jgi:REP element-mobilizing transposase RayT
VIVRGIERGKIFRSDYDRKNFLNRLGKLIPETQTDCFAWALIPSHVHLLLRTDLVPISVLMSRLLTGSESFIHERLKIVRGNQLALID